MKNDERLEWSKVEETIVTPEQMNEILCNRGLIGYIDDGYYRGRKWYPNNNLRKYLNKMCTRVSGDGYRFYLTEIQKIAVCDRKGRKVAEELEYRPRIYHVTLSQDNDNNNDNLIEINGGVAFNKLIGDFKRYYGVKFETAFVPDKEYRLKELINIGASRIVNGTERNKFAALTPCTGRNVVPSPINYGKYSPQFYHSCYKGDISSAFPYEASKPLPTMGPETKIINGWAEPTPELPFAFYIEKSGITLSSHITKVSICGENVTANISPSQVETTVLMPVCKYSLAPILSTYYNAKETATTPEEKQKNKAYMNLFVGYMQRNKDPKWAYITAVIIARCNARVKKLMRDIELAGGEVILVNTDSVAWTGPYIDLFDEIKALGAFLLEYENCSICVKGAKSYQIESNGVTKTVYAGVRKNKSSQMQFGDILNPNFATMSWHWNIKSMRFEQYEIMEGL